MKEKSKGGQRKGAGRKPSADPKQPVTIFVETSIINSLGGKEGVQFLCYGAIYGEKKPLPSNQEIKGKAKTISHTTTFDKKGKVVQDVKVQRLPKVHDEPITKFEQVISETAKNAILNQIEAIKAEKLPPERNTSLGRLSWKADQQRRISELEKQL